ncbi:MAG: DUF5320 domain-containing protein [Candidatus ainarchaeum sp.]|nr:DUF5320 domain-containing protein [Candidatus ainarchaeum sp.]
MPRGDGTGPNNLGPMTGRRMGYCAGYNAPGFMNSGFGRGYGRGFGRSAGYGRGYGRRFAWNYVDANPIVGNAMPQYKEPTEKEILEELKTEKIEIEKAIKNIEEKTKKTK